MILFFVSLAVIIYVYAGYPLLLRIGVFAHRKPLQKCAINPPAISVIVPAHNEESAIQAKIENLLASDYPAEKIEVLIGSDGSSDRTEDVVRQYTGAGVGLISFPQQQGKSAIQNGLVAAASGSVLVFTDADCLFAPSTLRHVINNFADLSVGLATGRPQFENEAETGITRNEGLYLRYETWLRQEESARGLLSMASGSLFAMRRELWRPLQPSMGDDFVLPLRVAQARLLNVIEPRAVAVTRLTQNDRASMFRMKVRIISKDFRALIAHGSLLNPFKYGALAAGLWSHKLLRWLVPYFLILLFAANLLLLRLAAFRVFLALQILFYALSFLGLRNARKPSPNFLPALGSFTLVNCAALFGTLHFVAGRSFASWSPQRTCEQPAYSQSKREYL